MNITQLKQGSLNGLRKQTNECLDAAYNKGYEDGKKEYKAIFSEEEIYNVANKERQEGYNNGYNNGLEDANHAMTVLENMTEIERETWFEDYASVGEVVREFTIQRIMKTTKVYEERKSEKEIKVGDIVKFNEKCHDYNAKKDREYLVLHKFNNGTATLLYDNGDTGAADISLLDKTGRHFDELQQLLDKMKK